MSEHKLFRVNQNAVLLSPENKILLLKREGGYVLPGGRLAEVDESPQAGLLRELEEETGIVDCEVQRIVRVALSASQRTYCVTFLCRTNQVDVELSDEHLDFVWVPIGGLDNYQFEFEETRDMIRELNLSD